MTDNGAAVWSAGQEQALAELILIAEGSPGLSIVRTTVGDQHGRMIVEISVDCSDIRSATGGVRLRQRERLRIVVARDHPFVVPAVEATHRRWAGTPHVQFGRHLCLYMSPSVEWDPSDGMFGFVERLLTWLERAAAGQLDAVGQPLHPPVAYSYGGGVAVVRADAPRAADSCWFGIALLNVVSDGRVDVVGWLPLDQQWPMTAEAARAAARVCGATVGEDATIACAVAVVLTDEIGFEFPLTAAGLATSLTTQGVSKLLFLGLLGLIAWFNTLLADSYRKLADENGTPCLPLYALIGTPSRGTVGGTDRITHLVAWRLPDEITPLLSVLSTSQSDKDDLAAVGAQVQRDANDWLATAEVNWATVYETRPEVATRRDAPAPARWLTGRRIIVLGAGALGARVAEACVRGSAAEVTIVDSGNVHPGILVRQPYDDADIGRAKATVLAELLRRIGTGTVITPIVADVRTSVLRDDASLPSVDLIVDATADRVVRTLLERRRTTTRDGRPTIVTLMIGHEAARGVAAVSLPGATGGPADILRRLGLTARTDVSSRLADVVEDFFPDPPRTDLFQPEPGCSDVTFTGGTADVTGLAGQLFTGVLRLLAQHSDGVDVDPMTALVIRMPHDPPPAGTAKETGRPSAEGPVWLTWPNDTVVPDANGRFEVRIAASARAEMRAEARRGARVRDRQVETGGLLIGSFDDAASVVWIDEASGPPPDSRLSAAHFQHGTEGVETLLATKKTTTARVSRFVGMWHTHPDGVAAPSLTDEDGMADLLVPVADAPRRALLLIIGAPSRRWDSWLTADGAPDWYARVVDRTHHTPGGRGHASPEPLPPNGKDWWPGGYAAHRRERSRPAGHQFPWWKRWRPQRVRRTRR